MSTEEIKRELGVADTWIRLLFIVIYGVMFWLAELVLVVVIALQFLITLFTGTPNINLRDFGQRLGEWLRQVVHYATYAADARPWPFGNAWPQAERPAPAQPDDDEY